LPVLKKPIVDKSKLKEAPRVVNLEPIKFNFPATSNFAELKARMKNFKKTKMVDDSEEAQFIT